MPSSPRPVVVVAHGGLASALVASAEMIVGDAPHVRAVDFVIGSSVDDLQRAVAAALADADRDARALVLVDLAGGSPSRVAAMIATTRPVDVVTGANLPMLIQAITESEEDVDGIIGAGTSGITKYGAQTVTAGGLR